ASASVQDTPAPDIRTWYVGGFLQDDWRVNRSLTLNLGVRYEYDQPKVDVTDRVSFFNGAKINPACNCPGVIEFGANKRAVTRKHEPFYNALMKQIGPRFAFAWTPLSRQNVVVRGGYAVFFTGLGYGAH